MKRLLFALFFMALLIELPGQEKFMEMESLVPGDALLFGKTSKISEVVAAANYLADNFTDETEKPELAKNRKEFLDATGLDLLDVSSLGKGGIDTGRPAGFAYFSKKKDNEDMLVMIPVVNMDRFPLKFAEMLKGLNKDNPGADMNPVITAYRDYRIHQIQKDIFSTALGGYFIIAPSGVIIKKVIDLSYVQAGSLLNDPSFMEYRYMRKESYDIDIFARGEMLAEVFEARMDSDDKDTGEKEDGDVRKGGDKKNEFLYAKSVKFMGGGLSVKQGRLKVKITSSLNPKHPLSDMAAGMLKTGLAGKALSFRNPLFYLFFSYNHVYLSKMCNTPSSFCSFYKSTVQKINMDYGIDLMNDFVPWFTGAVNLAVQKLNPATGKGEFIAFLPMISEYRTVGLWTKMRDSAKKKLQRSGFGEGKVGAARAFWYTEGAQKMHFAADARGLYIGNSLEILKTSVGGREMSTIDPSDKLKQKMTGDSFFVIHLKNDKNISGLVKAQAAGTPGINRAADNISDIYIRCAKDANLLSVDVDVNITGTSKSK